MSKLLLPEDLDHVELWQNPYDLRTVVKTVMAAQNWLLDRMPADQKLALVFGERHNSPSQKIMQTAIVQRMHEQALNNSGLGFAVGVEGPTNTRANSAGYLRKISAEPVHAHLFTLPVEDIINGNDPDGKKVLTMQNIFNKAEDLQQIGQIFSDLIVAKGISYAHTDIAWEHRDKHLFIDQKDPAAWNLVERFKPHLLGTDIARHGRNCENGMMLSNQAMAENGIAHMKRTNSRLYFSGCGLTHVFGAGEQYPYSESLSAAFENRGCAVLAITPLDDLSHTSKPDDAPPTIAITGYPSADRTARRIPTPSFVAYVNKMSDFNL